MTPATPAEAIRLYGGISLNVWTRTHHEPANWAEGQAIARILADGGEHKIAALFPAGVCLRQESVALMTRDVPVVSREEKFPCTRMIVEPMARPVAPAPETSAPKAAAREPALAGAGMGPAVEGGLFAGAEW